MYNSRIWLNPPESNGDSGMRCYDGFYVNEKGDNIPYTYLSIFDCYGKIKLHPIDGESPEAFIKKLEKIKAELESFIQYFKDNDSK